MNKSDYIDRGNKHLSDTSTYEPLQDDITNELKKQINLKLNKLHQNGLLTAHMLKFCKPPDQTRTSRLYFLQKIHKNPIGIRPIVSSCNSITENISEFVDHWLQPRMRALPSFIQDSTDFINLIETLKLPQTCTLASIDVSSLYTNIPHHEGKEAAIQNLTLNQDPPPLQPQPVVIGELIDIVLQNNVFEFNDKLYLQKQGTAMGTKMAPSYANLFMGKIEKQLQNLGKPHIHTWKRFIDDIFVIWTGSKEDFHTYMEQINQIHDTIKFTCEASNTEVTFLDVTVCKGEKFTSTGILDVRTHIKPTNKQLYAHASSYHPPATKKAIAKGEAKRFLRTNSTESTYQEMLNKLIIKLKERGYKKNKTYYAKPNAQNLKQGN